MSPTSSATTAPTTSNNSAATASTSPLANEETFLKLLVSQLQYQDPLNPVDSTQFVSQLTGYSQLEQLINIDHNTQPPAASSTSATGATSGSSTKTSEN